MRGKRGNKSFCDFLNFWLFKVKAHRKLIHYKRHTHTNDHSELKIWKEICKHTLKKPHNTEHNELTSTIYNPLENWESYN